MEEKEIVENEIKSETKNETEVKTVKPKFFVGKDEKIECVVNGFYNKENGMLEFAVPGEIQEETDRFNVVKHIFYFSRVTYDRLNIYRTQSTVYNSSDRSSSISFLKLREFLWLFHLTDWNFTDENGNKIELKRDTNNALSEESRELLYQIPASILDIAIGIFERKINIA